ncbi:MAG: VanZ family protein [Myxococcota bacterium]|nr:VanZ family protein [Myxococcota bacterium]
MESPLDTQAHEPQTRGRRPGLIERYRALLIAAFVCLACAITLSSGRPLWPNGIRWADPGPGLYFSTQAQALSEGPIVSETGEFSVEIFLKQGFMPGKYNQEILSFYDTELVRPLLIGQFPRGFILRGRADNPKGDPRDDAYVGVDEVGLERPDHLKHLAVVVSERGARLYVNGRPSGLTLPKTVARLGEPFGGHLLVGGSYTGWTVWVGTIRGVSIYDRALGDAELWDHAQRPATLADARFVEDRNLLALYRFEEGTGRRTRSAVPGGPDLHFPERMTRPTRRNFLSLHALDGNNRIWAGRDVGLNILFFVPLGIVMAWRRSTRWVAFALLAGFSLSLGIEIVQSYVPGRSSSLVDVASNATGAGLGALLTRLPALFRAGPLSPDDS